MHFQVFEAAERSKFLTFVKRCVWVDFHHAGSSQTKGLYKNDIEKLTGPKVYARSIEEIYKLAENKPLEWSKINKDSNIKFEFTINNQKHQARIFGIDYSNNVQFKHKYSDLLYKESDHWLKSQNEDSVY